MTDKANAETRNLHQRIAAITGEAQVKVTGRNAQGKEALSIADVDRILGDLMSTHRVTSRYSFLSEPTSYEEKTRNGSMTIWRVHLAVIVVNADDPKEDPITDEVYDDASNVSGAVSFALKRYLRALFKLAEDDTTPQLQARGQRESFTDPREARQPQAQAPSNGRQISAAQLADRGELYDKAKALGKTEEWVDTILDTEQPDGTRISRASVLKKLDKELAKREGPQEAPKTTEEPAKIELDPDQGVCPVCGKSEALIDLANEPGRVRCSAGSKGGCASTFEKGSIPTRAEWLKYKAEAEAAEPSNLEKLVDEAGVRPSNA